ncbi:MAG: c-type cytochrome [Planctomycetales bacterium]|nr:c-type cytochrome [Planctomycetales bacterium]
MRDQRLLCVLMYVTWHLSSPLNGLADEPRDVSFPVPEMTPQRSDKARLAYVDVGAKIPNYPPSQEWGVQDEPLTKMQKPLSPEESLKHFVTPVGFDVKLYAAEPDLGGKPIAMSWDEQGRLWVCESYDYPNELQPSGQGRDRIRICTDTDHDGSADSFAVFVEGLSIPTAITFYRGGAIVQNGVETLYLKDTTGDGRADLRKVLISNWELGDTHGGVSNFRYGHDNWIWAMQGYNDSAPRLGDPKIVGPDAPQGQRFRMGFFRFRLDDQDPPNVTELEFIRSTDNNTWGLGLTEEGIVTGSTANHNPSVYMPIENRYYERVRGWAPTQLESMADNHLFEPITDAVRQVDHHGGYTAGAGHAVYTARVYPQQYWNRTSFVCGPTGHLVGTFVLLREGADMRSYSPCNLLASTDEWTAPIAAEVGPDGNVWVLDWYNYIVQHNPTPRGFDRGKGNAYETDLRDKKHGRIYRVEYTGNESAKAWRSLRDATPQQLVVALRHPTMTWRLHAQRLLVERGEPDVVPELIELVGNPDVDAVGQNYGALHALWTLAGLGVLKRDDPTTAEVAAKAMGHPSAAVRRAACTAIPLDDVILTQMFASGHSPLNDSDHQVRLAALKALADFPHAHPVALDAIQRALEDPGFTDRWLSDGLLSAASVHGELVGWFLQTSSRPFPELSARLAEHAARGRPTLPQMEAMLTQMAKGRPENVAAAIRGLVAGWPPDHQLVIGLAAERSMESVYAQVDVGSQARLIQLARWLGSRGLERFEPAVAETLLATVHDAAATESQRVDAATQLVQMRPSEEGVQSILGVIGPHSSPEFVSGIINALGENGSAAIGRQLVSRAVEFTPLARQAALQVLLQRPATTLNLLDGIESGQLHIADLQLVQRQMLANHPDVDLRARWSQLLAARGGLPNADRQKVIDSMLAITEQTGDVASGRRVFEKQCATCHRHGTIGQSIGPDLTGMAVHPKAELLVHILDPSRSVEGNFRQYTVATTDGSVISGLLAAESKTAVELIDSQAKRHAIARSDIELLQGSSKSVMPEGFEQQISRAEFADLLEFLTDKGKYVPLNLNKVVTAISSRGLLDGGDAGDHRVFVDGWGNQTFRGVPFQLIDPQGKSVPNVILLHGPQGSLPPTMPRQVELPVNMRLKTLHLLSGIGVRAYPEVTAQSTSLIVRFQYAAGRIEDHELKNGVHFADCSRRIDVPGSEFALMGRGRQVRYLAVQPKEDSVVESVILVKGDDTTAPIVVAVTLEPWK